MWQALESESGMNDAIYPLAGPVRGFFLSGGYWVMGTGKPRRGGISVARGETPGRGTN